MSKGTTRCESSQAIRYGRGPGALRPMDGVLPGVTGAEARGQPVPDGGGLEIVDR